MALLVAEVALRVFEGTFICLVVASTAVTGELGSGCWRLALASALVASDLVDWLLAIHVLHFEFSRFQG